MSEDKKDNLKKKEDKKNNQAEEKPVSIKAEKKENKKDKEIEEKLDDISIGKDLESEVLSQKSKVQSQTSEMEELPEDVRKKLEKRKADKNKKSATSGKKGKMIKKKRRKQQKIVSVGKAFIKSTYNNTIVTLTDLDGNVISWASAGIAGFKGPKKSTPYAAQIIARIAVEKAKELGLSEVSVFAKGVGTGRESAIRALNSNGLNVTSIKDITPIPHNGCRKRKPRRV